MCSERLKCFPVSRIFTNSWVFVLGSSNVSLWKRVGNIIQEQLSKNVIYQSYERFSENKGLGTDFFRWDEAWTIHLWWCVAFPQEQPGLEWKEGSTTVVQWSTIGDQHYLDFGLLFEEKREKKWDLNHHHHNNWLYISPLMIYIEVKT